MASTDFHSSTPHVIAFPFSSIGGGATAMLAYRLASPTPRGCGKRGPSGDLPKHSAVLPGAGDAPASRRAVRLGGSLRNTVTCGVEL